MSAMLVIWRLPPMPKALLIISLLIVLNPGLSFTIVIYVKWTWIALIHLTIEGNHAFIEFLIQSGFSDTFKVLDFILCLYCEINTKTDRWKVELRPHSNLIAEPMFRFTSKWLLFIMLLSCWCLCFKSKICNNCAWTKCTSIKVRKVSHW